MIDKNIYLEICGKEIEFVVSYNFYKGEPVILRADPNDCHEGSTDEYELLSLECVGYEQGRRKLYDVSYLLDDIKDEVIEILECIIEC